MNKLHLLALIGSLIGCYDPHPDRAPNSVSSGDTTTGITTSASTGTGEEGGGGGVGGHGGSGSCAVANLFGTTCAELEDKRVFCWGDDSDHQLGVADSGIVHSLEPIEVDHPPPLGRPIGGALNRVGCIGAHHQILCAGTEAPGSSSSQGKLGDGQATDDVQPELTATMGPVANPIDFAAGYRVNCAISGNDGSLSCWGNDDQQELFGWGTTHSPTHVDSLGTGVDQVVLMNGHGCARKGGLVYCWGDDAHGQLGDHPPGADSAMPILFPDVTNADDVAVSLGTTYVLRGTDLWAVGIDPTTQTACADAPTVGYPAFEKVPALDGTPIKDVAAGWRHACALTEDSRVFCGGMNCDGQTGQAGMEPSTQFLKVDGLPLTRQISVGPYHSCALGTDKRVYCWGRNGSHELGVEGADSAEPRVVQIPCGE